MRTDLLAELSEAHGTSGREDAVAGIVRRELGPRVARIETDPLGGLCGIRPATGAADEPIRLMLAAHMDEIGLMVTGVDDQGFLRVIPLGGWDARTLVSQRVVVHGRETLAGMVGVPPVHTLSAEERTRAPKVEDLRTFHTAFYGADQATFAASGDFDAKEIQALVTELFGSWKSATVCGSWKWPCSALSRASRGAGLVSLA